MNRKDYYLEKLIKMAERIPIYNNWHDFHLRLHYERKGEMPEKIPLNHKVTEVHLLGPGSEEEDQRPLMPCRAPLNHRITEIHLLGPGGSQAEDAKAEGRKRVKQVLDEPERS